MSIANRPVISVCMITYNQEEYIAQAIEGVLMQKTNFPIELIIGEDCSTDQTRAICLEYQQKYPHIIRLLNREHNLGMIQNFALTLRACRGKYIALCEGDDYWIDCYKLQKQVDFLESNENYVLIFHQADILMPNGETWNYNIPKNHENLIDLVTHGNYIQTASVVFRNILSSFPSEFYLSPAGDYFLYILLAENGKIKYFDDKMSVYRYGVGIWAIQSLDYRHLKSIHMDILLASYFVNKPLIAEVFITRTLVFFLEKKGINSKINQKNKSELNLLPVSIINFILNEKNTLIYLLSMMKFNDLLSLFAKRIYIGVWSRLQAISRLNASGSKI